MRTEDDGKTIQMVHAKRGIMLCKFAWISENRWNAIWERCWVPEKQEINYGMKSRGYFDVDLTVRKLVMNRLGQLLRNFRRKLRQTYILPNQDTPSKLNEVPEKYTIEKKEIKQDEEPTRGTCGLKGRVNKDGEYQDDEDRSVGDKTFVLRVQKEMRTKIKEGTLQVDQGTDAK
ncbi:hypothetical protein Tco_0453996 [Tanacetum coccineum]